ncbi:MAG: hypothetical protein ACR5KV_00345 [Wolbachia sp.]
MSSNEIGNKDAEALVEALKNNRLYGNLPSNNVYYTISSVVVGAFLGLSIACFTGATPVGITIAVFPAVAIIGALVGYGVVKFYEKGW